ncbi:phospholipase A [Rhodanobacter sp. B2A1Ga4]|uniref:phospholipase A n=1 Tax=Rhodanobacter sp. B2A1Ga4 TaxID=2778647 RepID=UPI001B363ED2|nr:phospholipase A [Rhodanobacter sp. B2A1Ga4]MBQ4856120.1 phospholipase A [Rhodanobacter sp. B2A1Ga4]
MKRSTAAVLLALFAGTLTAAAHAQNPDPTDIRACTAIESDAQRLACYDHATGRVNLPIAQKRVDQATATPGIFSRDRQKASGTGAETNREVAAPLSLLDSRWELSPESKLGTFNIRGYKPVFVLPIFATSNQNNRPHSPNPDNTVPGPGEQLDNAEMKFQLSLKSKLWQGVFGDAGDLWVGYTQSSRWQVYNAKASRPFRETNYEPEAMLVFDTHYQLLGWDGRMLGIGFNHQSNGRSNPLSRSWNRVIANIGFERDGWTVMLRPWWRVPEARRDDNNPDISNYMGRGEMQIVHEWRGQEFGMLLRHSLRGGSDSHGSARFSWSFPVAGNLRGYMEVFKGYGESLIDYNHNATYLGLGVSLLDWY